MRLLLRPVVRAFVRSQLPARLLMLATRLEQWSRIQRAYLRSDVDGLVEDRAAHWIESCHAAVDWWNAICDKYPSRHRAKVCRPNSGWEFEPPIVDARFRKELAKRCIGRSPWV